MRLLDRKHILLREVWYLKRPVFDEDVQVDAVLMLNLQMLQTENVQGAERYSSSAQWVRASRKEVSTVEI